MTTATLECRSTYIQRLCPCAGVQCKLLGFALPMWHMPHALWQGVGSGQSVSHAKLSHPSRNRTFRPSKIKGPAHVPYIIPSPARYHMDRSPALHAARTAPCSAGPAYIPTHTINSWCVLNGYECAAGWQLNSTGAAQYSTTGHILSTTQPSATDLGSKKTCHSAFTSDAGQRHMACIS